MEVAESSASDEKSYWKLVIPRERILFVQSPGTEEFEIFLTAMEEARIVAMDAEWKPVRRAGMSPRVSILQMSCRIRKESKAWATMEKILLARRIRAEVEESFQAEKSEVEKQRDDLEKQREELQGEREEMQEEIELEKRKVRRDRENLKRERAEKKRRDKKEREELLSELASSRKEREAEDVVDERPTLTKLQDGLKELVLGRNGEISEVAADLAGGDQQSTDNDVTTPKVNTEDPEQNIDNLLDVLAQAQKEMMKHQEGEQHTYSTEAKLDTLSKDDNPELETNYAFPASRNLTTENGLISRDTEIEDQKVKESFEEKAKNSDKGEELQTAPPQTDGGVGETESKSSIEQVADTGSEEGGVSDGDQVFSDAGENEFDVDEEVSDRAPELVHSSDGKGLTEEEWEIFQGEEVIFVLDMLALLAADFALPMKKMLCSSRILKLGFEFKNDQLHLAASFPDASGCFDKVEPYIEIAKLYKQLIHASSASMKHKGKRFVLGGTYSLTGISKAVLGHPLRKDSQCSDWEQRPLTNDQFYYAAADTHCLLAIFDALLSDALALISPPRASAEAGDKPGFMIQQRAPSLREVRGEGLKFLTGLDKMRETTPVSRIYTPRMSTASQMVEAALRPSPLSSPREPVVTDEQRHSAERFSKFVKKYSDRLLVNDSGRSKSHARRPRGRRAREALKNPDNKDELNLEWVGPAPWDTRIGGDGVPKFLCDVMIQGLARQLRCIGIDAASPPTKKSDPRQMVEQSEAEGRILLTKDIKLLRRRLMPENLAYFVKRSGKWEQLEEVMKVFQITVSESELLSRCVKCNGEFTPRPLSSKEAKAQAPASQDIPRSVLESCEEYWQCSVCGHLFWQGFQFDRAKQKFAAVCVKAIQEDSAPEDDGPIEPLAIACEFLEEPEKAFAPSHGPNLGPSSCNLPF